VGSSTRRSRRTAGHRDRTPCVTLGLAWTISPVEGEPVGLRLADDAGRLLETREEHRVRELEEGGEGEEARQTFSSTDDERRSSIIEG
jgi:hypothetical protein